jgi:uncharacterized RDD family membrane protein YckC
MKDRQTRTYAGFWKRAAAFALDYVIIVIYLALLTLIGLLLNSWFRINQSLFSDRVNAQLTGFLLVTLPVTLYFAVGESSGRQATWGKAKLGLLVTDDRGERISFWRALARTALKFVPWELSHTIIWTIVFSNPEGSVWVNFGFILVYGLISLNLASLVFTRKHQTIYDLLAKTFVT